MSEPVRLIVLLHADQMRYDALGCCGNTFAETPHLDALAAEGCVFDRHWSTNPICMPSRASLLTGSLPSCHGVWANGVPLARAEHTVAGPDAEMGERMPVPAVSHVPTLADVLAEAGWQTASVGKLHLTPTQASRESGYEESSQRWADGGMDDWHGPYYGFQRVDMSLGHGPGVGGHYAAWLRENFPDVASRLNDRPIEPAPEIPRLYASPVPPEAHHSTWAAEMACERISRRDPDKPMFLFVGFPDPHVPFAPPAELARRFADRDTLAPVAPDACTGLPSPMVEAMASRRNGLVGRGVDPEQLVWLRRYTDAQVHLIDRAVGRILEAVRAANLWGETAVAFTSDHGDYLGDYGMFRKAELPSAALCRVPMLLRAPGRRMPARSALPCSNADVLPTLCELAGVSAPAHVQGASMLNESGHPHAALVQCYGGRSGSRSFTMVDAAGRVSWHADTGEVEAYDHAADPAETRNLAAEPNPPADLPGRLARMKELHLAVDRPMSGRIAVW